LILPGYLLTEDFDHKQYGWLSSALSPLRGKGSFKNLDYVKEDPEINSG